MYSPIQFKWFSDFGLYFRIMERKKPTTPTNVESHSKQTHKYLINWTNNGSGALNVQVNYAKTANDSYTRTRTMHVYVEAPTDDSKFHEWTEKKLRIIE